MVAFALILAVEGLRADDAADFFHHRVQPILRQHCYSCHSHASQKMESGLALIGKAVGHWWRARTGDCAWKTDREFAHSRGHASRQRS